ncbi:transcriptional regulator [Fusobacterium polymorphum]|uniref:Transcriptional regulator n=1 Tax=Fusobacterium nucleatum subsp. polymorphum TaxID=76857 RepID=A0A2B7YMB0_FUSNP|nr:sigma factor-like helix-turn-helix DNA-binding protein [Fusobacterium polymorphum]PGH21767.1 transcriptional regulator [Fusobacterium polymorphum]
MATQEQKIIFRKMEDILYSYNKYVNKIKKDLEYFNNPILLKSYNIEKISGSGFMEVKSDMERIEELKVRISNDISRHEEILFRIDSALDMIKDHKDYSIVDMKYLNNMSYEDISEKLGVSLKTVYGMRNRILGALEIHFKLQKLIEF